MVYRKSYKGLPPLRISTLCKKAQDNEDEIWKKHMKLIISGMIGSYNYIGTSLDGLTQGSEPKEINPFSFSSWNFYFNKNDRRSHWVSHSKKIKLDTMDFF